MTDFMPSQEQRGEPTVTSLKAELAAEKARVCIDPIEHEAVIAELAALKQRLAGLGQRWRDTHDAMTCAKAAADLDAALKENNDE